MASVHSSACKAKWYLPALAAMMVLAVALLAGGGARSQSHSPDAVQDVVGHGRSAVAEFGSTRCRACREMKLVLAELQRTHGDRVAIADVDLFLPTGRGMISRYRVQMMPMQIFFDAQGNELGRHLGPISGQEILHHLGLETAVKQ